MSKFYYDIFSQDGEKIYSGLDCNEAEQIIGIPKSKLCVYVSKGYMKDKKYTVDKCVPQELLDEWDKTVSRLKPSHKKMKRGWA